MTNIKFTTTKEDTELIAAIVERAMREDSRFNQTTLMMDISATHANDCGLRLDEFLAAPDADFLHDIYGIYHHMNRETGKLGDFFLPRYASRDKKPITMTVLISRNDGSNSDSMECTVEGKTILDLKNDLDEIIITMLKSHKEETGEYVVDIKFEEEGTYLDGDDSGICYCDLDTGTVRWEV